jgi:serine protease Do
MKRHSCIAAILLAATLLAGISHADEAADRRALRRTPVVSVFENCRDAVVNISTTQVVERRSRRGFDSMFDELFDYPNDSRRYELTSVGSGFVIHQDGYVVTNAHVVARTVERKVIFPDGTQYDAELVAIDIEKDLAVLKINAPRKLKTLKLGRSDDLMIGETAIAIGNPLGYEHTLTSGVVSALNRSLEIRGQVMYEGLIQTDASINPGNSGGPLLNVLGELIGVNTAIRGDAQNIGFSIGVDQLRKALPQLLDIERRYGIEVGMDVAVDDVARVIRVEKGSPAEEAGVALHDRLVAVDGLALNSGVDFCIDLIGRQGGDVVKLNLLRGERPVETTLKIRQRPRPDGLALASKRFGVTTRPLTAEESRKLGLRAGGLLLGEVNSGGPADEAGLFRGDILISIDRSEVRSLDDLGKMLEDIPASKTIDIVVLRPRERALYSGSITLN